MYLVVSTEAKNFDSGEDQARSPQGKRMGLGDLAEQRPAGNLRQGEHIFKQRLRYTYPLSASELTAENRIGC